MFVVVGGGLQGHIGTLDTRPACKLSIAKTLFISFIYQQYKLWGETWNLILAGYSSFLMSLLSEGLFEQSLYLQQKFHTFPLLKHSNIKIFTNPMSNV